MNDLEQRITQSLADQVSQVHAPADLAVRSLRRGRTAVRRRRAGALSVAAVAVVAVIVPAAVVGSRGLDGGPDRGPQPATTGGVTVSPSPSPPSPPAVVDRTHFLQWFRGLPAGEPAVQTFIDDRTGKRPFRYQGVTYRRPGAGNLFPKGLTTDGLLAAWHTTGFTGAEDPDARYILLRPDGSYRKLVTGSPGGVAISADRTRVAYTVTQLSGGSWRQRTAAVDLRSGKQWSLRSEPGYQLAGWTRDGVLVTNQGDKWSALWQPGSQLRRLGARSAFAAGPGSDRLVREANDDEHCQAVVTTADFERPIYAGCNEAAPVNLSGDGRWVLLSGNQLRNLDTGEQRPLRIGIGGDALSGVEWDGERLLAHYGPPALKDGETAYARCDLDGRCERAGEIPPR